MKIRNIIIIAFLLTVASTAAATPAGHADAINAFFADILLVVNNLKGLVEPIVGLAVAVMIAMQAITMRRQKKAQNERTEQTSTLASQNDALAHISRQVETVKNVVTTTAPEINVALQPSGTVNIEAAQSGDPPA